MMLWSSGHLQYKTVSVTHGQEVMDLKILSPFSKDEEIWLMSFRYGSALDRPCSVLYWSISNSGVSDLGPKYVRLNPNGTNPGSESLKYTEMWSENVPDLSHFGPIWTILEPNMISLSIIAPCLCRLSYSVQLIKPEPLILH